jgi:hypothetical protein
MNLNEWNKNPLKTKKEKYKCHGSNLDRQPKLGSEAMRQVPYRERKEDFVEQSVGLFSLWKLEQSNSKNHYNLTSLLCLF